MNWWDSVLVSPLCSSCSVCLVEPAYTRAVLKSCCQAKDRTEAQQRGALHSHILFWTKRRKLNLTSFVPMPTTFRQGWQKGDGHGTQSESKRKDVPGKASHSTASLDVSNERKEREQARPKKEQDSSVSTAPSADALSSTSLGSGKSFSVIAEPVDAVKEPTVPAPTTQAPGLECPECHSFSAIAEPVAAFGESTAPVPTTRGPSLEPEHKQSEQRNTLIEPLENHIYWMREVARVNAELIRPKLSIEMPWPRDCLLWAFLLRSIQTNMYLHSCTPL